MAIEEKDCPSCKKIVITFKQMTSTMPQDESNQVRKYLETYCAYCGICLERKTVDEIVT